MKRVYTAMTSVCADPPADTAGAAAAAAAAGAAGAAGAAAAEDFCTGEAAVILLLTLPLRTYPVVTRIPFCSASAQLKGATAGPLMPVILSARTNNWPATPFTSLLPVLVLTRQ